MKHNLVIIFKEATVWGMKTKKDIWDYNYRKVEAMYRKGFNIDNMVIQLGISKMDVLDMVQKVFAMDMRKQTRVG